MPTALRAARKDLFVRWQGVRQSCGDFFYKNTLLVDEYLCACCKKNWPQGEEHVALVALGGYGRKEMFPGSDVDLMLLYAPAREDNIASVAAQVFQPLWDAGLEVGHSVRTVQQSLDYAEEDFFFQLALLDARLLWGSEALFVQLQQRFRSEYIEGERKAFAEKIMMCRQERLELYGHGNYLLEPHVKNGCGGMRDVQAMVLTGREVFGLRNFDDFRESGLFLEKELKELLAAIDFLFCLRLQMHLQSKRGNDQLYLEGQAQLAELLEYRKSESSRAVELFMADVYRMLQTVHSSVNFFFEHTEEVLGLSRAIEGAAADKVVENGIEVRRGRIHCIATEAQAAKKPQTLMRVFLLVARTGLPIHYRTRQRLPGLLPFFGDKERRSPRLAKAFFSSITETKNVLSVLMPMLETGVLVAIIPEFQRVVGLAQHDLYHIYTVDRHLLQTVHELHAEIVGGALGRLTDRPVPLKLLYLAALIHDIGKGRGEDHSELGADLAKTIAIRLSCTEEEAQLVAFLVRYHLYMPENALRRDLEDPIFISQCARLIGNVDRLVMLYLLSIADSRATGPSAWSEWKALLLEEMYLRVRAALLGDGEGDVVAAVHQREGVAWLREQLQSTLAGSEDLKVDCALLSDEYILAFSPEIVARHLLLHKEHFSRIRQLSLFEVEQTEEGWEVLVMATDRPGILAKICGVLILGNLSVSRARIFTWYDGTVVDVLTVTLAQGFAAVDIDWDEVAGQLNLVLAHRINLGEKLYGRLTKLHAKQYEKQIGEVKSKVLIDNQISEKYSVIEVHAVDISGRLYHITQRLTDLGLSIYRAYIATEVELLIDVFYVLNEKGEKLEAPLLQERVRQEILQEIS